MKLSQRIAFCGILCAIATVILMATLFPYATYALAAMAGLIFVVATLELGVRYGVICYIVTAALSLLVTPDPEAKLLFVLFFGYYPIIQLRINLWKNVILAWGVKLAIFNTAMVCGFLLLLYVVGLNKEDFTIAGVYLPGALLIAGNVVFVLYDRALIQVGAFYRIRLHPYVKRMFRF